MFQQPTECRIGTPNRSQATLTAPGFTKLPLVRYKYSSLMTSRFNSETFCRISALSSPRKSAAFVGLICIMTLERALLTGLVPAATNGLREDSILARLNAATGQVPRTSEKNRVIFCTAGKARPGVKRNLRLTCQYHSLLTGDMSARHHLGIV